MKLRKIEKGNSKKRRLRHLKDPVLKTLGVRKKFIIFQSLKDVNDKILIDISGNKDYDIYISEQNKIQYIGNIEDLGIFSRFTPFIDRKEEIKADMKRRIYVGDFESKLSQDVRFKLKMVTNKIARTIGLKEELYRQMETIGPMPNEKFKECLDWFIKKILFKKEKDNNAKRKSFITAYKTFFEDKLYEKMQNQLNDEVQNSFKSVVAQTNDDEFWSQYIEQQIRQDEQES